MRLCRYAAFSASLLLGYLAQAATHSVQAQEFYRGKTLTILVGFSSGGGFDLFARLLSRHIGNFIPGHPAVVVKNMPGAGSMTSVRNLVASSPKDGTVLAAFHFGLIGQSRLTPEKVPLDFRQFAWIGSISQDLSICYTWHTLGIKNLAELKARKNLHFGLTGVGTNDDIYARILKWIFGVDLHQVGGYPGSAEVRLAVERGELDGHCGAWSSLPEEWIRRKLINPVYRTADYRPPDMPPDVPYMMDLVPNERDRAIIRVLVSDRLLGRPFIAALDVPPDRIKILRDAFDATVKDPPFLVDAEKSRLPVSPKNAKESIATVEAIYATSLDIVAAARKVMTQ